MGYTKGDLVEGALTELGIAGYEFDMTPEQLATDIRRLDSMMAEWANKGILLSYPTTSGPDSSVGSTETNVPDTAIEAIITNLALRLAPSYGKNVLPDTRITAKNSLTYLMGANFTPKERQVPIMPVGAGYKQTERPFSSGSEDRDLVLSDESFDITGGLEDGS